jgi:hypothetical protein
LSERFAGDGKTKSRTVKMVEATTNNVNIIFL